MACDQEVLRDFSMDGSSFDVIGDLESVVEIRATPGDKLGLLQ